MEKGGGMRSKELSRKGHIIFPRPWQIHYQKIQVNFAQGSSLKILPWEKFKYEVI